MRSASIYFFFVKFEKEFSMDAFRRESFVQQFMQALRMSSVSKTNPPSGGNQVVLNVLRGESVEDPQSGRTGSTNTHMLSLPILTMDHDMNDTIFDCMKKNQKAFWLLKISGNYWPDEKGFSFADDAETMAYKCYYLLARLSLFLLFVFYLFLTTTIGTSVFSISITLTIILDTVSVFPAQYNNQLRLHHRAKMQGTSVIDESTKISLAYGAIFVLTSIIFLINYLVEYPAVHAVPVLYVTTFVIGEFTLCGYLMFNLFMLLVDVKVASISIDQMFLLAESKSLSLSVFNSVRSDIHRRVNMSKWTSDLIIIPCVASAVCIAVMFAINNLDAYNFIFILSKELIFVAVAFWYVARVNERADQLTKKIGASMWENTAGVSDTERLSIVTSCMLDPISFTLLLKRLSWQNVAVSFAGFAVSILIGIIKQVVKSAA